MTLGEALKARAVEVGFDLVGIAPAVPGRDLDYVREWLDRGYAGEMAYLSNPKRLDPALVFPSLQSVICVGLIYDTPLPYSTEVGSGLKVENSKQEAEVEKKKPEARSQKQEYRRHLSDDSQPSPLGRGCPDEIGTGEGPRAWISRYAWGHDYHEIMRVKLEKLRAEIERLAPGADTCVYVDTGPISERAFARFSGLGWVGKNTCIINEEKGSWFFLGVILTSLALEPDLPAPDRCGSCTACLDACPTRALVEPYVMDATRCISYLTIELKGSIPQDLRKGIGSNIFGCDICQDVCPWNGKNRSQKREVRSQEEPFWPMTVSGEARIQNPKSKIQNSSDTFSLFAPPLEALAAKSEDEFRQTFRHSPIRRTKFRGWLRNLAVAMGNSGDARFIPKLQELAASSDPIIREHAEWAIAQFKEHQGAPVNPPNSS